ncbi:MAG TPA: hypothetical protein PLF40_20970 [Kofleriaceae bacterium]|nr:hypothetical protein [Kofleriaceae bacterium]
MWIIIVGLGVVAFGAIVVGVRYLRRQFGHRVVAERLALMLQPSAASTPTAQPGLPAPVERYRQMAVGTRSPVQSLRMTHGGSFTLSPTSRARPIEGKQLFTADPPGFVWTGRVHMAPGLWIDARDMIVDGHGSMRVLLDDAVTLADAHGPKLDSGAALRLLAEMAWYPIAFFDARSVTWTAIDDEHARATLHVGGCNVSCIFTFGPDGLPRAMSGLREYAQGGLLPWSGTYRDWRDIDGMRVPFEVDVTWQLDSGPYTYAHWQIKSIAYDGDRPSRGVAVRA